MNIRQAHIKRILIIKLKGTGDVILSTVMIKNLAEAFPNAELHYLTERPSIPILEAIPEITRVIPYLPQQKGGGIQAIARVVRNRYDLVIDAYSNPRTALITFLSSAKYRLGFPYRGRKYAYNFFGPAHRTKYHSAELHLQLISALKIPIDYRDQYLVLPKEDILFAEHYIDQFPAGDFIGLCPGGGWASKKCDPEVFARIGDALVERFGCRIMIHWGKGDAEEAKKIESLMKQTPVMAPETTFLQMGALMRKMSLLVSNDSGPMHLAAALGVKVLGLFGPTDPALQGPFGTGNGTIRKEDLDCIGCNLLVCPRAHECFTQLPVQEIVDTAAKLLQSSGKGQVSR